VKIVADQNMADVEAFFGHLGSITYLPGREISAEHIGDADLLLVRSVTRVNQALLEHSSVAFVGSATIGTDHIDRDYLQQRGIGFAHAPGCNADAVVQYDLSVLSRLQPDWLQKSLNVGIVGCGNVGRRLYQTLTSLNINCRVYDPFLSDNQALNLVDFDTVLQADALFLHTPLTHSGPFPTRHLFNADALARLTENTLLVNAGRGAVIDNTALLARLQKGPALRVALDVWEGEPEIDLTLMANVLLATPHIAGYSIEGKIRGTAMLAEAYGRWCIEQGVVYASDGLPQTEQQNIASVLTEATLNQLILASYDVAVDDRIMREAMARCASGDVAEAFDRLRKDYPERHEFAHFQIGSESRESQIKAQALAVGFYG